MESVIFVLAGPGAAGAELEAAIRRRYAERHRIVLATHEGDALDLLRAHLEFGEQIALVVFHHWPEDEARAAAFAKSRALCPHARTLLLSDEDGDIDVGRRIARSWQPAESVLYPAIDELLADWRVSREAPSHLVGAYMNLRPVRVRVTDSLHRAAEVIALTGVDLMVIDDDNRFAGVLAVGDILRAALPTVEEIVAETGTLEHAFRLFLRRGTELAFRPVAPLVVREPLVLSPEDHIARAAVAMIDRNIHRAPVLRGDRLVGTIGRSEICDALVGRL